ncbi:hypothetical protein ASE17_06665 [Phenylobacterium sp. Root77]|jgi:hypothetical protein|uniref:acyloxyacyl hydrolase n=1 Tax=unclassified Phenylobacterium TaxID=2640670 RepID=UPI0006FFE7B5|nr:MULTISPECIES: acyloxyacyl hydrolase [unclassified Phenylobacterium]KQW68136.1 hypothetical protein ASC73_16570 [Phenylobacterium sp. Root1277]KQW91879.1 hypothetical protein ASC79_09945 [Phenylobacterium sp. Root1290]KRC40110.1 hypothetical protein ASE17_06665 [Phenylobacterium sp. Root77]
MKHANFLRRWAHGGAAAALAAALGGHAQAQELRVGVGYSPHEPEVGSSVIVEYLFPPASALKAIGAPRPFVSTQLSLDGYTNYAQGGLIWRFERQKTYLDLGAGVAVHDGSLYLPRPEAGVSHEENLRRRAARDEYIEFDKRWVFHATFAVGYRLNERWAVELEGQHWSNGQFSSDTHDGADSLGLRAAYRF